MKLTQKNFNNLIELFNHKTTEITDRLTKVEISTRWMKWIMGYMAVVITGIFVKAVSL